MSNRLDTAGTYRGEITVHSLSQTRNGLPQFVARFRAAEKWVDDPNDMAHFKLEEPAWVDWSEFGEEITGFLVLFRDSDEFSEDTALLNYEQLQLAVGWDGDEFQSLNDGTHAGKSVLFRVEEDEYEGKVQLKVNWIDANDASPVRELKKLSADKVKDLSSKLKVKKTAKPAAAKPSAKPVAAPPKATPKAPPKATPKAEEAPVEEAPVEVAALSPEITQAKAWEFVCDNKGGNSDSDVQDAWIAACEEVAPNKDEDDFTDADWAKVRDIVIRDLSLDV